MSDHGNGTEPEGRENSRSAEADWNRLKADPLAWIRELAYAHAEKLRNEWEQTTVIILDDHRRSS